MATAFEQFIKDVKGKKIDVVGIGISNTPVITMLAKLGAVVAAYDKTEKHNLGDIAGELESLGVTLVCGESYLEHLSGEIVIKTPGLRFDHPALAAARGRGAKITSEMELFFDVCPCKIIAVTGSDGKTTTTSLIYEMLTRAGYTCHLGGNIGKPLLPRAMDIKPTDIVVAELSSFQLHTMTKSPDIAVVTNLSPNHLDVHKSMDEYVDAKTNIFKFQSDDGLLIVNYDNEITNGFSPNGAVRRFSFKQTPDCDGAYYQNGNVYLKQNGESKKLLSREDILLRGDHNVENYMAAILAVKDLCPADIIVKTARSFGGVRHRIEYVATKDGVMFYNDSIGSSPTRTIATLRSFDKKVILIAGGYDKKLPFDALGPEVLSHCKALFLTGATRDKIASAVTSADGFEKSGLHISIDPDFEGTVRSAAAFAKDGDIVLLSPACASFDAFKNFEVRGDRFIEIVNSL